MNPCVLWFYGLSGAGKTSLSEALAAHFKEKNIPCLRLDGDYLRAGLSRDLQFTTTDRAENIRRTAEVARLACQQGLVVLVALITPTDSLRASARSIIQPFPFQEIFLDCDYQTSANRDVKGLYARAEAGLIHDFTGKDSVFETPSAPDLSVNTSTQTLEASLAQLLSFLAGSPQPETETADFKNPLTQQMAAFLNSIGLQIRSCTLEGGTFLPGLALE